MPCMTFLFLLQGRQRSFREASSLLSLAGETIFDFCHFAFLHAHFCTGMEDGRWDRMVGLVGWLMDAHCLPAVGLLQAELSRHRRLTLQAARHLPAHLYFLPLACLAAGRKHFKIYNLPSHCPCCCIYLQAEEQAWPLIWLSLISAWALTGEGGGAPGLLRESLFLPACLPGLTRLYLPAVEISIRRGLPLCLCPTPQGCDEKAGGGASRQALWRK